MTNESIRPLPTSFALQNKKDHYKESERSAMHSFHSMHTVQKTTDGPVLPKTSLDLEDTLPRPEEDENEQRRGINDLIEISEAT